jgi:transposase
VMEATGGYERLPFGQLWAEGIPAALINPRSVRRFAEAVGKLEKTDRIDCAIIAWYAEVKQIQPTPPASATQQRLTALVLRLRQLTELRVDQVNQRHLVSEPDVQDSFTEVLAVIARQIRTLELQIAASIEADPLWAAFSTAFREVKGVAGRSTARILADLPEIGTLTGKAVAKLNGLAPIARDSGKKTGRRPVRGGRESVRSILYVIVRIVCRYDNDFKACYDRLKAAGKPAKVIRIALARKLLVRLNAKARDVRASFATAA